MLPWICLLAGALSADPTLVPLLQTLPDDGRWAKYHLRLQAPDQDQTLSWTVRSVGQFQQAGRDVRCIELERAGGNGNIPPGCHRLLVPVDAFGSGKHPLGQTVRMWSKEGNSAPESFESLSSDPVLALFLAGATEDVRRQDQQETIDWQRGQLKCEVFTGRSSQDIGDSKFALTWTILRHADVPFGLAGVRAKLTIGEQADLIQVTLTLQDHGQDAKATLPELTP